MSTERAPVPTAQHTEFAETVAGGPLTSEGRGAAHRYRSVVLGCTGLLVFALGMLVSYSTAFTKPHPHDLPLAVTGSPAAIVQLEQEDALDITVVQDAAAARDQVLHRDVDGALVLPSQAGEGVTTYTASGGGKSLAATVSGIGDAVAQQMGTTSTVTDLAPLHQDDPGGTLEFYAVIFVGIGASLAASVLGRILGTVDTPTAFVERSVVLVAYTGALAGLATAWVDGVMGGLTHDWAATSGALWLYALAIGGAITGVAAVGGTLAALAVTLVTTMIGNPSSGGPYGIHLLPGFFQSMYWFFPQGDGLEVLRSIEYFDGDGAAGPLVRLGTWAVAGLLLVMLAMLLRTRRAAAQHQPAQGAPTSLGQLSVHRDAPPQRAITTSGAPDAPDGSLAR